MLDHLTGLNLKSMEVEVIAMGIRYLISLSVIEALTRLLWKTIIEYHQLELGTDK